jgi:deazaflavin-dependent oxidoreductase (nitroreductase family)
MARRDRGRGGGAVTDQSPAEWLQEHAEIECCYLTTTGRRSGQPHEIEIWFGVVESTLYLISGNGPTADWYQNVVADPEVTVRIEHETRAGRASVVTDPQERRRVGDVMGAKYVWDGDPAIGLTYPAWCYDVPALAVEF